MKVKQLFQRRKSPAQRLYAAIVASARQPALYGEFGAPDTVEGRMTMISLNLALAVERLKQLGAREPAQQLVEAFFVDMEGNLREQGVSDVAIPRRVRAVEAVYVGVMKELEVGLSGPEPALRAAITASFANLPGGGSLTAVVEHAGRITANLAVLGRDDILDGKGWN